MATRLSAAGALTWWHLDDCGEFVFQVGLPLDLNQPQLRRGGQGGGAGGGGGGGGGGGEGGGVNPVSGKGGPSKLPPPPPPLLLGPTGKPVVKLFVFAEKEDYEWIAQDGVMNQTMKQSALDLFDTPDHYLPQRAELTPPYSAAPLGGGDAVYQPPSEAAARAGAGAEAGARAGAKLPVFWIAPLEAGGCPLLSPPNVIHLVLTVRDCVMVEERRLSLMFLDEVGGVWGQGPRPGCLFLASIFLFYAFKLLSSNCIQNSTTCSFIHGAATTQVHYFHHRQERWCEPPVQYRFLREDLVDPARCRVAAALPLLHVLRAGMTASAADDEDEDEDEDEDDPKNGNEVGLYKLKFSLPKALESAWFQPSSL
jgi:hypothetical protein